MIPKELAHLHKPNHPNLNCCQRTLVHRELHSFELIFPNHFNNTKLSKNMLTVSEAAYYIYLFHAKYLLWWNQSCKAELYNNK